MALAGQMSEMSGQPSQAFASPSADPSEAQDTRKVRAARKAQAPETLLELSRLPTKSRWPPNSPRRSTTRRSRKPEMATWEDTPLLDMAVRRSNIMPRSGGPILRTPSKSSSAVLVTTERRESASGMTMHFTASECSESHRNSGITRNHFTTRFRHSHLPPLSQHYFLCGPT